MPGDTDLVDAGFALLLYDLALWTALDLVGLDSHYLGWREGEWKFLVLELVVVGGKFLDHLLDLLLLETTHEAQGAPLERDNWGCLLMELFGRVQDRAITANRDHKINFRFGLLITEQIVINLMKRLEWLLLDLVECPLIQKVKADINRMWKEYYDFFNQFEHLLLLVDAAYEKDW